MELALKQALKTLLLILLRAWQVPQPSCMSAAKTQCAGKAANTPAYNAALSIQEMCVVHVQQGLVPTSPFTANLARAVNLL
jgi:hypothetical protein